MIKFSKIKKWKYKKKIFLSIFLLIILNSINIKKLNENEVKVCLCVVGKKENLYAKEFIEHYKNLGYNKIFIYDNNDINEERFEDIISDEINIGFVSIINYRGIKSPVQLMSYVDCYKNNNLT